MGFAESGESIEEAALRELEEEAGIKGKIIDQVNTESGLSETYGDLLFTVATLFSAFVIYLQGMAFPDDGGKNHPGSEQYHKSDDPENNLHFLVLLREFDSILLW